jgi:hypothetical protein
MSEPKPSAADLRIKFYEDQKKARMDYYAKIRNDMGDFAKDTMRRHEDMQAATRKEASDRKPEVKRSFVELKSPGGFSNPPAKVPKRPQVVESEAAAVAEGAFFTMYVDGSGDTYLQGGTVTGGDGTVTIADIKVIDAGTGIEGTAGDHLYIDATGDGVVADDVLIPGWNLDSATTGTASTVPSNTLPTAADELAKKFYLDLGVFTADDFLPSSAGNIRIFFCPGSYSVART